MLLIDRNALRLLYSQMVIIRRFETKQTFYLHKRLPQAPLYYGQVSTMLLEILVLGFYYYLVYICRKPVWGIREPIFLYIFLYYKDFRSM